MHTFRLWKRPQSFPLHLTLKFYFILTVVVVFSFFRVVRQPSEIKREWVIEMEIYGQKVIHSQRNKLLSFISHIYFPRIRWMEQVFLECSATFVHERTHRNAPKKSLHFMVCCWFDWSAYASSAKAHLLPSAFEMRDSHSNANDNLNCDFFMSLSILLFTVLSIERRRKKWRSTVFQL